MNVLMIVRMREPTFAPVVHRNPAAAFLSERHRAGRSAFDLVGLLERDVEPVRDGLEQRREVVGPAVLFVGAPQLLRELFELGGALHVDLQ
jgi:hypothetical protein